MRGNADFSSSLCCDLPKADSSGRRDCCSVVAKRQHQSPCTVLCLTLAIFGSLVLVSLRA